MTSPSAKRYLTPALILAVAAFVSAIALALLVGPDDYLFHGPAAIAVNALGLVFLIAVFGIGIIAVAAFSKRAAQSAPVARAISAIERKARDLSRPKLTSTAGMSTADELTKWAALLEKGVVTQDEFDAAKAELLKIER